MPKKVIGTIGHVLLHFMNIKLQSGKSPDYLKTSIVIPIQKVANTIIIWILPNQYPSLCWKLLELMVYNKLLNYLNQNNIYVYVKQIRFSTTIFLWINFKIKTKSIDEGKYIVALFLDLKRWCETFGRNILIKTLELFDIQGTVLT